MHTAEATRSRREAKELNSWRGRRGNWAEKMRRERGTWKTLGMAVVRKEMKFAYEWR